jgi:hypothetical protein
MKIVNFVRNIFSGIGFAFITFQILETFFTDFTCSFKCFIFIGISAGIIYFFLEGYVILGYLKNKITIKSNSFNGYIHVIFGDIFKQDGWKAISVNEFFDNQVDDEHVAHSSLHGQTLDRYWKDSTNRWYSDILKEFKKEGIQYQEIYRKSGNKFKFKIGSTAKLKVGADNFLFVSLTHTNLENLEAKADTKDLQEALTGLMKKARSCCAGNKLNIPLFGSGLSRTGISSYMLIDLIILSIFQSFKEGEVTKDINIVLPKRLKSSINLEYIKKTWEK